MCGDTISRTCSCPLRYAFKYHWPKWTLVMISPFYKIKNERKTKKNIQVECRPCVYTFCARYKCKRSSIQKDNNLYAKLFLMPQNSIAVHVFAWENYSNCFGFHTDTDGNCTNFDQMIAMRILCMRNDGNTKPVTMLFSNQVKIMRRLFANKTCKRSLLSFKKVAIVVVQLSLFNKYYGDQPLLTSFRQTFLSPDFDCAFFRNLFVFIDRMCVLCTKNSTFPSVNGCIDGKRNFEARTG